MKHIQIKDFWPIIPDDKMLYSPDLILDIDYTINQWSGVTEIKNIIGKVNGMPVDLTKISKSEKNILMDNIMTHLKCFERGDDIQDVPFGGFLI